MKVVLQHEGRWLHFQNPERVLRTDRIGEVVPLLRQADASGLFCAGFVAYEAAPAFDPALQTHPPDGFPLLCLGLFHAPEVLDAIEEVPDGAFSIGELEPSVTEQAFCGAIAAIKERIAEGATYQVNYTYRLAAPFSGNPWSFFCKLVRGQKASHAAFVDTGDYTICSASPELFFHRRNGMLVSRPMKGTARRGRTLEEDGIQAEALRRSAKDRAENIMIVDMIRNDIGRLAVPGTVQATSCYDIEKYPTVWQMTSTVRGRVDAPLADLFQALFPCASITGAPKAKTMEIIRGLECSPRKIYTGAIGFAAPGGEACFNVAIRTALVDRAGSRLEFGVGGGIVWDSDAVAEYEETLTKARVLTQPRPDFRLLETLRWEAGSGIFLLNRHLRRLADTAAYFDIPANPAAIRAVLEDYHTSRSVVMRLRLLVSRDGSFVLEEHPLPDDAASGSSAFPLRVALATGPVDSADHFLYHKTTHRAAYEQAKADFPDCDDVILWNERGEVTESTIANVVVRLGNRLVTPPVECGLLAGTFRDQLLENGEIEEGVLTCGQLRQAEEIHLVNSVRKWRRARLVE